MLQEERIANEILRVIKPSEERLAEYILGGIDNWEDYLKAYSKYTTILDVKEIIHQYKIMAIKRAVGDDPEND